MIFVRATTASEATRQFGDELAAAAQLPLGYVLDGRHPIPTDLNRPAISITRDNCEALGLYCRPDFAWKCGDYGLYLARKAFPEVEHFWQIEYDVRFVGLSVADFFAFFADKKDDFLATHLMPTSPTHRWFQFGSGRGVVPWRCMFPLTRFSARALDILLARRRRQGKSRQRRATWPNDEPFAATTLVQEQLVCHDFNDFGRTFYSDKTFSFHNPFRGEELHGPDREHGIYHPVLFGSAYESKMLRLAERPSGLSTWPWIEQRVRRPFNRFFRW